VTIPVADFEDLVKKASQPQSSSAATVFHGEPDVPFAKVPDASVPLDALQHLDFAKLAKYF
jgi:hypothetical protein